MATPKEMEGARLREAFLTAAYAARKAYLGGFKMRAEADNWIELVPATY